MLNNLVTILTICALTLTGPVSFANSLDGVITTCSEPDVIRRIMRDNNAKDLQAKIIRHFKENKKDGVSDEDFCADIIKSYNGDTEAGLNCPNGTCAKQPPQPRAFRRVVEETKVIEKSSGGDSFLTGMAPMLGVGLIGFALGTVMGRTMNRGPQYPQPFGQTMPQWGMPGMGGPQMFPFGGSRQPLMLPYPGNQFGGGLGGGSPWMTPYNPVAGGYGMGGYGMGGYGAGVGYGMGGYGMGGAGFGFGNYGQPAPPVLPLAPQNYSIYPMPATHWGLINSGR